MVLPLWNSSTMGTAATGPHGCLAVLDTCTVGPCCFKLLEAAKVYWRHQLRQSKRGARRGLPTWRGSAWQIGPPTYSGRLWQHACSSVLVMKPSLRSL